MANTIVNRFGKLTGWNDIKFMFGGYQVEGITEIEYSDEVEVESVMGGGRMPIGYGQGNYSAKGSITLLLEERLAIMESLPPGKRIQDIKVDIPVVFEYNNKQYSDLLRNVIIKNTGLQVKQGDKSNSFKFDLHISHIEYTVD